jgi:hypothetical protein
VTVLMSAVKLSTAEALFSACMPAMYRHFSEP